jgi:hypothetical protein
MNRRDYVAQILRERSRATRRAMLERVPFHMREQVRCEVQQRWPRARTKR